MRVLFDHQTFSLQSYGGISLYFTELAKQFQKDPQMTVEIPIKISVNQYLSSIKRPLSSKIPEFKGRNRLIEIFNRQFTKQKLKKGAWDIFHPTYYTPYFLKYLGQKPFVLTAYDCTHERFPQYYNAYDLKIFKEKKNLFDKASHIISISESTKKDLIEYYQIPDKKITVIHLATSFQKPEDVIKNPHFLLNNYFLFVGVRSGYKNFENFIQSARPLLLRNLNLKIVCAGGPVFSKAEIHFLESLNLRDQIIYYPIKTKKDLWQIYHHAIAFIYPSISEGFGIPLLEAMSSECPIIASDNSCFPEIAGNAGLFFDPSSQNELTKCLEKILSDQSLRDSLVKAGIQQRKKFSWEKTAAQTKNVYQKVLA